MADAATLRRPTGGWTTGPDGSEVPATELLFTSPCKVQARQVSSLAQDAGGRTAVTVRLELHLPVSAPLLDVGDEATITATGPTSDPQMVGWQLRVTAPVLKSYATARRYEVSEVTS
jgi:hypothetical protein